MGRSGPDESEAESANLPVYGRCEIKNSWPEFTGENRIILLCVMAAQYEPVSDKYLKEFFEELGIHEKKREDDPVSGFLRMMDKITSGVI